MNEQRVARVRAEMQAHGLTQMIISDSKRHLVPDWCQCGAV